MSSNRISIDGAPHDGVGHQQASLEQLARYREASDALGRFEVPVLINEKNPHERLFIAAFDGTGNNKFTDPKHATNVANIDDDIMSRHRFGGGRVYSHYVEGPGTQDNWFVATADSIRGHSYEAKVNEAYVALVNQANRWAAEDPDVVVRVHNIGFSRGSSQVPGLARLVHEKGIPDLDSHVLGQDGSLQYERYIAVPGEVVQTVGLFDPVATGAPMNMDRRLPPSVVSGFQITSGDERRASFPSDQILPPGLSEDGRFLNVIVPGAHSDVGGGYLRDGLSIRCSNLMRDYCNALSEAPYLDKVYEHTDERLNVIHRSTDGKAIFRLDPRVGVRGEPSGTNEMLAPRHVADAGPAPHRPEPVDASLEEGLVRRRVPIAPANLIPSHAPIPPVSPDAVLAAGHSTAFAPTVLRSVNAVASAVDLGQTLVKQEELRSHGNKTGANSELLHFGSRNVAGWAGAEALMAVGTAAGVETGPGMFVTGAVGGVIGFVAGDKIADHVDQYRIAHQQDPQGNTWAFDQKGQQWTREIPPLPDTPHGQRFVADAALSDRLTYQAGNTAVELALASERRPRDPFMQPAAPGDTPSLKDSPWSLRPDTQQWTRAVADHYLEHGMLGSHVESASPQRAAELNRLAEQTVRQNVAESSLGVAQRYQYAYEQKGWARHGPVPEAVTHELKKPAGHIVASDGHDYSRGKGGQWSTPGALYGTNPAGTKTREELNLTEGPMSALKHAADVGRVVQPPPLPTRLDHPAHPDHEFFQQVRGHVVELDRSLGRAPDHYTDNISSALTVQARADGMKRVDQIELSDGGDALWAVQTPPGRTDHLFDRSTNVPTAEANTPMEQSAAKWPEAMRQYQGHEQSRAASKERAVDRDPIAKAHVPQSLSAAGHHDHPRNDPRNPDNKNHAMYNELQRCLPDSSDERLLQFTAECHRHRITAKNLGSVHVNYDQSTLSIDSHDLMSTPVTVDLSTPPPLPEQSIRHIEQFDQQMAQIKQESQDRSAQMGQQGPVR